MYYSTIETRTRTYDTGNEIIVLLYFSLRPIQYCTVIDIIDIGMYCDLYTCAMCVCKCILLEVICYVHTCTSQPLHPSIQPCSSCLLSFPFLSFPFLSFPFFPFPFLFSPYASLSTFYATYSSSFMTHISVRTSVHMSVSLSA
jgi:hypothetical protein